MASKNVISAPVIQIPPLSREEIHNLLEQTEYTERQIKEWQRGFYEECPGGELSKQKLQDFYCLLLPSGIARVFVDQLFGLFDSDKSGSIDFNEFLMATDMPTSGTAGEKLKWLFEMYDGDGSGAIGMSEMLEILSTLHDMEGVPTDDVENIAKWMFQKMEIHEDDEMTLDQFSNACLIKEEVHHLLRGKDNYYQ